MKLAVLVGSGRKIGLLALPFLVLGVVMNILFPAIFTVGGPSMILRIISIIVLVPGVVIWGWSVFLIISKIPKKQLITSGPYALIKHPLYAGVALLVLPWIGFLCNTWMGLAIGLVVYVGSRLYGPEEEKMLRKIFGKEWEEYLDKVMFPWI
jgi:protein-S-isoprenylcysteine O-methyltransferase Ste14